MGLSHTQAVLLIVGGITIAAAVVGGATIGLGGEQPLRIDSVETTTSADTNTVLEIDATINNTGTSNVTQPVGLQIDATGNGTAATTVATRTVTVPSETTKRVSFAVAPEAVDPGPLTYVVVAGQEPAVRENDTVTLERPTFTVAETTSPTTVRGEQASVTATLHNDGHFRGMQPLDIRLDRNHDGSFDSAETVDTSSPMIAASNSATVEFTFDTEGLQPGTYAYRLAGPVDTTEGTLKVVEPATFTFAETNAWVVANATNATNLTQANATNVTNANATTVTKDNATTVTSAHATTVTSAHATTVTHANATTVTHANATNITNANVTRGDVVTLTTTVRNDGDVAGTEVVRFDPPGAGAEPKTREIRLEANSTRTLKYTMDTAALARGNYSMDLAMANQTESLPLRVRQSYFRIAGVRGEETLTRGEDLQLTAIVYNIWDVTDNKSVVFYVDLDDDDTADYTLERTVRIAPGERTTVQFTAPYFDLESNTSERLLGAHVYGIQSPDHNTTDVIAYEPPDYNSGGTASTDSTESTDGTDSGDNSTKVEPVSLDDIAQEKYGSDFDQLSNETTGQVSEIHERQPFAEGLVVTEVKTREEIANQQYGLDPGSGDSFNFTAIDVETQQKIEADFDAQFQSDSGDRIESWDELARQQHGSDYDTLTDDQQQSIRKQYLEQFEES